MPNAPVTPGLKARHLRAFTITELVFVVLLLSVVALLVVPRYLTARAKASRISCAGRHKQVSLAHKVFANERTNPATLLENFTMQLSTNFGGTMEWGGSGNVAVHYQNMSNELGSAKILVCPDDHGRIMRSDFSTPISNSNVSYAVGLDADELQPNMILASDNHMTSSLPRKGAIIELSASNTVAWSKKLHGGAGNIALADGSVQQVTTAGLQMHVTTALTSSPTNRHRLEFP